MNLEEIKEKYTEEEILKIKRNSNEMTTYAGDSLDKIVLQLENLRRNGKLNWFANFNGIKLYSIDVTMNSAYKECLGSTRETWIKKEKKWLEDFEIRKQKWDKEANEKLPGWIEEGHKYIHPNKFEKWKRTCVSFAESGYGFMVKSVIDIMKMIEDGIPFEDIKKEIKKQGHSGMTYSEMMNVILYYSKRGPAFYNFMNKNHMGKYDKIYVSKIKKLNKYILSGMTIEEASEYLLDNKIMDITITSESNILNGTILVKEDGTFEGIVDEDNVIVGKLIEEKGIAFANFCNYKKVSNYSGLNENGVFVGKHELYSSAGNIDDDHVVIELKESKKDFANEIGIKYEIEEVKKFFDEHTKQMYCWYTNTLDLEVVRIMLSLQDGLQERLLNALKARLEILKKSQKMDVLSVPRNVPYCITVDKLKEFTNQKTDLETSRMISKMSDQFITNNLIDESGPVLKKIKKDDKNN